MSMTLILSILVLVLLLGWYWYIYRDEVYVRSSVDHQRYLIRSAQNKTRAQLQESADLLAQINGRVSILFTKLKTDPHCDSDPECKSILRALLKNYKQTKISEAAYDTRYTTFTVNKDSMHICLKTRNGSGGTAAGTPYNLNLLTYVILHELSHMANYNPVTGMPIVGHGPEFNKIFAFLIHEAILSGIYTYEDYSTAPQEYCGMTIETQNGRPESV